MKAFLFVVFFLVTSLHAQEFHDYDPSFGRGKLVKIPVEDLHPTQAQVGKVEVEARIKKLERYTEYGLKEYLRERLVPIIVGPGGRAYMIDHHHMASAILRGDLKRKIYGKIKVNWAHLGQDQFWEKMKQNGWVYLFDNKGQAISPSDLPLTLRGLKDDPFRSLAWSVRELDGFKKTETPFVEFIWANFFREHISLSLVRTNYEEAVERAFHLSQSSAARDLPGYRLCDTHFSP